MTATNWLALTVVLFLAGCVGGKSPTAPVCNTNFQPIHQVEFDTAQPVDTATAINPCAKRVAS